MKLKLNENEASLLGICLEIARFRFEKDAATAKLANHDRLASQFKRQIDQTHTLTLRLGEMTDE